MLYRRFMLVSTLIALGGLVMLNIIESTRPGPTFIKVSHHNVELDT